MLALLKFLDIDKFASSCVYFFHFLNLCFKVVLAVSHHFTLLLKLDFLLKVGIQVVGDSHGVTHVLPLHERSEHFFLANDAVSKRIELRCAVSNLLMRGFRFVDKVLAIRQVATDFLTDHH